MLDIAILAGLLAVPTLSDDSPTEWITPTYSKQGRLEVQVRSSEGQELPGAVVFLCPMEESEKWDHPPSLPPSVEQCSFETADAQGVARFERSRRASYWVVVHLDGFATTMVYPLSIGGKDALAPDRVLVVLNGLCWDC